MIVPHVVGLGTARFRRWVVDVAVRIFPSRAPRQMRDICDTIYNTSRTVHFEQVATFGAQTSDKGSHLKRDANLTQLLRKCIT